MRRMLFGLLTFGACATNATALAGELSAMDDFFTSPLRKTLDPQVEVFPLALEDRRFDPRANAEIAAAPVDSMLFDRIGLRDGPVDTQAARPTAEFATADFIGPPFWASDQINIVGRKPNLNTLLGYQAIVDAIKFQGWLGAAAQARIWRLDQENRRPSGGAGLGTIWELDAAPSSQTMFFAKGFYSDVFQRSLVEIKPRYAVLDNFSFAAFAAAKVYIGPYAVLTGHWRDKLCKAGLQLTFGEIGAFTLTFAGGLSRDKYAGAGAFGMIESSLRF
ncbi:MAG TPA: cellulose biosynthesis protein BcsS [Methylocystis sp.]